MIEMKLLLNKFCLRIILTRYILAFLIFVFSSCVRNQEEIVQLKSDIIKLQIEVDCIKYQINKNLQINFNNWIYCSNDLTFYNSANFNITLSSKRPSKSISNAFFCVPAAFTDDPKINHNLIDGHFIVNGTDISNDVNHDLSGACIFDENNIEIIPSTKLSDVKLAEISAKKRNLFQQFLLVKNKIKVECNKYKSTPNLVKPLLRRALVQVNNDFYVVESKARMTLSDFQDSLIKNNFTNAIYLDMGTYSEGWYRGSNGITNTIGEDMVNTSKQSNWLIFETK